MDNRKYIEVEGDVVAYIHYMPFDEKNGLGKTEEELLTTGFLVEDIADPELIDGKYPIQHYSLERGFWFEYKDIVPEPVLNLDNYIRWDELASAYAEGVESIG